jgi:16S rRNA (uracil1498-N3)-methyltransferase
VPRLFIPAERLAGEAVQLTKAELRHARAMRIRSGDRITIFDDQGTRHEAVVRRIGSRGADIELHGRVPDAPCPSAPPVTLIAGILKGHRMDTLVEKATELGVHHIIPAVTEFTVARPGRGDTDRVRRWRRLAVSAATQCGQARVPTVDTPVPFPDAARSSASGALRILMWEEERRVTLPAIHAGQPEPAAIVLAIGPEGGFDRDEVTLAREAGFEVSGLGPRTLRAETAAIVALALCQATWGDLRAKGC